MKFTLIGAAVVVAAAFVAPVKFIRLRPGAQLFQHVCKGRQRQLGMLGQHTLPMGVKFFGDDPDSLLGAEWPAGAALAMESWPARSAAS